MFCLTKAKHQMRCSSCCLDESPSPSATDHLMPAKACLPSWSRETCLVNSACWTTGRVVHWRVRSSRRACCRFLTLRSKPNCKATPPCCGGSPNCWHRVCVSWTKCCQTACSLTSPVAPPSACLNCQKAATSSSCLSPKKNWPAWLVHHASG